MGLMMCNHPWGELKRFVLNKTLQSVIGLSALCPNAGAQLSIAKFVNNIRYQRRR